jgi:hypothetical protein
MRYINEKSKTVSIHDRSCEVLDDEAFLAKARLLVT